MIKQEIREAKPKKKEIYRRINEFLDDLNEKMEEKLIDEAENNVKFLLASSIETVQNFPIC